MWFRRASAAGRPRRRGQGMTEYIIIVALVAIATIALVTIFGNQIRSLFSASAQKLAGNDVDPKDMTGGADGEVQKSLKDF